MSELQHHTKTREITGSLTRKSVSILEAKISDKRYIKLYINIKDA